MTSDGKDDLLMRTINFVIWSFFLIQGLIFAKFYSLLWATFFYSEMVGLFIYTFLIYT